MRPTNRSPVVQPVVAVLKGSVASPQKALTSPKMRYTDFQKLGTDCWLHALSGRLDAGANQYGIDQRPERQASHATSGIAPPHNAI